MSLRLKAIFILGFAALALFGRSFAYDFFIFDDGVHIKTNPYMNPVTWAGLFHLWTNSMMAVTYQAWAAIAVVFGTQDPLPYRIFSLLLHVTNGCLVGALLLKMIPRLFDDEKIPERAAQIASFLGALFFLVHPVQVESVVWISATKDLLSSFFAFCAVLALLNLREKPASEQPFITMVPIYALVGLSFLSKPSGLALPLALIWIDFLLCRRGWRQLARDYGALAVIAFFGLKDHQDIMMPTDQVGLELPFLMRFAVAADVFVFDLSKVLMPFDCYFDYGKTPISILRSFLATPLVEWRDWLAAGFALFFIGIGVTRPKYRAPAFALGLFVFAIFPHSGIIPFVHQNISNTANRYLYFPLFAVTLFFVWLGLKLRETRSTRFLAAFVVLALFVSSFWQIGLWQDSVTMLEYTIQKNPSSFPSRIALAEAYDGLGRKQDAERERAFAEWLLKEEERSYRESPDIRSGP